jgi:hypothetical protein
MYLEKQQFRTYIEIDFFSCLVYSRISDTSCTETGLAATNCDWFGVLFTNAENIKSVNDVEKKNIQIITKIAIFCKVEVITAVNVKTAITWKVTP